MRYPHIISAIRSARWAATEHVIQAIRDALATRISAEHVSTASAPIARRKTAEMPGMISAEPSTAVAVIPIFGILGKHLSSLETECGGCDVDEVGECIESAVEDPRISSIVLHFDSPGGVVTGIPELAAKIRAWDAIKPIYAFTDSMMASAAYWMASGCRGIFCTSSADVGSIGVYCALIDESEAWAKEGSKLVLIKAGARKGEGMPGAPISAEAVAALQTEIDTIYAMFTADVTSCRPHVGAEAMQGQTFFGAAAVTANLCDSVIPDLDTLLGSV